MQQPPFHNPNSDPLPDANDVESEFNGHREQWQVEDASFPTSEANRSRLEADKRWMRNVMIGLLVGGLAIGGLLSIGLVWGMNQLNLIDPPTVEQRD